MADEADTTAVETSSAEPTAPPATATPAPVPTEAPTDPTPSEVPEEDTDDADLPEWASGETITVDTDTGPLELPVELAPFCESSRSFYVAARGLNYVEPDQSGTAQQLFAALAALSPSTIETAPSADFAAQPIAARDYLAILIPAFEQVGYDTSQVAGLPDAQAVFDALEGFGETRESLQAFLVQTCGADVGVLYDQASGAADAAAAAAGETIEPAEPVEPVAGSVIENDDSTITLSVPLDWTETVEYTADGHPQLAASSDLDGFLALTTPGVLVLRGKGGLRDGGFTGQVLTFQADLEAIGCELTEQLDYDDGTYRGQERILDCGADGLDVRLFGGTTSDESLYAMVLLVNPVAEPGVRQLIVESFLVS